MLAVSDQFKAAVNAATRHLDVILTVLNRSGTERVYTSNDALLSLKIVDGKTTGGFGLGATICPSLTAELHKSAVISVSDKITVQIVVKDGGNLTLASEFSVDDIKRRPDGTMQVTALGLMIKLGKNHVSSITYPATQYQLLSEIAARAGVQLHPTLKSRLINNPTIKSAPVKGVTEDDVTLYYTRRELLEYTAAINGGFAIIDQYGYLDIVRYNYAGEVVSADRAFREDVSDRYDITDVQWNTTGISNALYDDFDNGMVEFYNPLDYADSERDTIIFNLKSELIGLGYEGAIIQKQGCGYFQVGDGVTYKDVEGANHDLLIMGIVYSFADGYFTETLYSLASSENRRQYAGNENLTTERNPTSAINGDQHIYIVLTETQAEIMLHEYQVVETPSGKRYIYGQTPDAFVVNRVWAARNSTIAKTLPTANRCSMTSGKSDSSIEIYISDVVNKDDGSKLYYVNIDVNGKTKYRNFYTDYSGDVGFVYNYSEVHSPTSIAPYGYAEVTGIYLVHTNEDGETVLSDMTYYLGVVYPRFSSMSEYRMAAAVTETINEIPVVNETITKAES